MNQVLSLVRTARLSPEPGLLLGSNHMLVELLGLNEDMIQQLHLERQNGGGHAPLIADLIEQHEKAAAMLRAQLEKRRW